MDGKRHSPGISLLNPVARTLDQEFVQFDYFVCDLFYDRELVVLVHDLPNGRLFPCVDDHAEVVSVERIH